MLVKDTCKLANTGASKLNKFLTSNWSKGLDTCLYNTVVILIDNNYNIKLYIHEMLVAFGMIR